MKKKIRFICPKCGKGRWKTVKKGEKYRCRNCGFEKDIKVVLHSINIVERDREDKSQGEVLKVETK